jgi:hypothetical protein
MTNTYAERIAQAPATFLGKPVPPGVAAVWKTWEGVRYRQQATWATNTYDVPDQRFSVLPPPGMCTVHLEMRRGYQHMYFDPRKGYRWPGTPVLEWSVITTGDWVTERRVEWDDKASEQMRLIEEICLSGRSPQCEGARTCVTCGLLSPTPDWLAWVTSPVDPGVHRAQTRESRCTCEVT